MVVIPQDVYDNVVVRPGGALRDPLENRLQENSARMTSTLHSRKNPDEKYLEYDQTLKGVREMLSQRQERVGLETMLERVLSKLQLEPRSAAEVSHTDELPMDSVVTETDETIHAKPHVLPPVSRKTTKRSIKRTSAVIPKRRPKKEKVVQNTTLEPMETAKITEAPPTTFERIHKKVMENPTKYGVGADGIVSHRGSTTKLEDVLRYLLGESSEDAPPGTNAVRSHMLADEDIKQWVSNLKPEPSATRQLIKKYAAKDESKTFKASLWEPSRVKKETFDGDEDAVIHTPNTNKKQSHTQYVRPEWKKY